jgi:hypothetical protein
MKRECQRCGATLPEYCPACLLDAAGNAKLRERIAELEEIELLLRRRLDEVEEQKAKAIDRL